MKRLGLVIGIVGLVIAAALSGLSALAPVIASDCAPGLGVGLLSAVLGVDLVTIYHRRRR